MGYLRSTLFLIVCLLFARQTVAQDSIPKKWKVAVFAPVYLDTVFYGDTYKLGNNNLPKFMLPGLDFYNGMMLAIDSLNSEKAPIEVVFYDTKSKEGALPYALTDATLNDVALIIAAFNNRNDIKPLADFALEREVPLISATYPNDGGISENPYFILINPTLRTHCEGIYKYLQRVYPTSSLTMFRRKGALEDMIQSVFTDMARNTAGVPLKIRTIELPDSFSTSQVIGYLDSTRQNIVICGTLNEAFGTNLVKSLSESKKYRSIVMGMPTWDGLKGIDRSVEIIYTTPYQFQRLDNQGLELSIRYRNKYAGRPSDMVYKGFESMYHFTKLLLKHQDQFLKNISEKSFKVFNDFDIQPVRNPVNKTAVEYLENKKLYFIRKMDGQIRSVN